jgi:hypothetical protein
LVIIQGFSSDDLLGDGVTPADSGVLGKGKYVEPEFAWHIPLGPRALKFLNLDKLGKKYENSTLLVISIMEIYIDLRSIQNVMIL